MIEWTTVLTMASGPVIGAIIGYVTNYVAVKMLFRPLNPIKIGGWTLPFTPGIFPKRKEQLAKALGNAVGNNLLTRSDVTALFMTESMTNAVVGKISQILYSEDDEHTIKQIGSAYFQHEIDHGQNDYNYERVKEQLENVICERIRSGLIKMDVGNIIAREVGQAIKEKTQGTMLALMVNDKLIASLTTPIGERVDTFVAENSSDMIQAMVNSEIETFENQPIGKIIRQTGVPEAYLKEMIERIYSGFIQNKVGGFIEQFDIAGVVENKVNAMDVCEIESLVLSVMKNELKAIVNLGALIGFIIGLANLLL